MYIINNEICSRLVCKEHEAMKGKMDVCVCSGGEVRKDTMLMDPRSGSGGGL